MSKITNEQKYKTPEERTRAHYDFCKLHATCGSCPANGTGLHNCHFAWLALEVEETEKPLPCPFCGSSCAVENVCTDEDQTSKYVCCSNEMCMYQSANGVDAAAAIAAHNIVARAVNNAKESEVKR